LDQTGFHSRGQIVVEPRWWRAVREGWPVAAELALQPIVEAQLQQERHRVLRDIQVKPAQQVSGLNGKQERLLYLRSAGDGRPAGQRDGLLCTRRHGNQHGEGTRSPLQ
jgi:hypothetical protein